MVKTATFPIDPAKVLLAGDWHGNIRRAEAVIELAGRKGIAVIIHLGDFGFWVPGQGTDVFLAHVNNACKKYGITLLWVDGNHEDHSRINNEVEHPLTEDGVRRTRSNILYLPRGFRWNWRGRDWMALGGAHSVDTHMRREGVSVWQEEHLSSEDVAYASREGNVDVMVTHDCPDNVYIPGLRSGDFPAVQIRRAEEHREVLGTVVDVVKPIMLFHGHYHRRYRGSREFSDETGSTLIIGLGDDGCHILDNILVLNLEDDEVVSEVPYEIDQAFVDDLYGTLS